MATKKNKTIESHRPIHVIAYEIHRDWGEKIYFGAKPHLNALMHLDKRSDYYGVERAEMLIAYFLSNASTWRGETARRIKLELKSMIE